MVQDFIVGGSVTLNGFPTRFPKYFLYLSIKSCFGSNEADSFAQQCWRTLFLYTIRMLNTIGKSYFYFQWNILLAICISFFFL